MPTDKKKRNRKKTITTCPFCRKEFQTKPKLLLNKEGNPKKRYCSRACYKEDCKSEHTERFQKRRTLVSCATCGKSFFKLNSQIKRYPSGLHYCSRKCKWVNENSNRMWKEESKRKISDHHKAEWEKVHDTEKGRRELERLRSIGRCFNEMKDQTFLEYWLSGYPVSTPTKSLKVILIRNGIRFERCESCGGYDHWNNKPLVLQMHHKDGDTRNNAISNLQMLCPNCHSQTPNYAGKSWSRKRKE